MFDYPVLVSVRKKEDPLSVILFIVVTTSRHKKRQEIYFRLSASRTVGNIISYLILFLPRGLSPNPHLGKITNNTATHISVILLVQALGVQWVINIKCGPYTNVYNIGQHAYVPSEAGRMASWSPVTRPPVLTPPGVKLSGHTAS